MVNWIDGAFTLGLVATIAGVAMLSVPWSLIVGGSVLMTLGVAGHVAGRHLR